MAAIVITGFSAVAWAAALLRMDPNRAPKHPGVLVHDPCNLHRLLAPGPGGEKGGPA
jgi:hypothetical protein